VTVDLPDARLWELAARATFAPGKESFVKPAIVAYDANGRVLR
jgi:hypothetical protein